jgi:hypothetical protein
VGLDGKATLCKRVSSRFDSYTVLQFMIKVLEYSYTDWCQYTLAEKELIVWPEPNDKTVIEYMSWYEFGQLMGGN